MDQSPQAELRASWTLEEELLELFSIQIAVLIKSHEDGDVSSGQGAEEFFIRDIAACGCSKVLESQRAVWTMDLREQSRGEIGPS